MRIIAGEAKGRRLHSPRSRRLRPTLGRARQVLFDILGAAIEETRLLDLYAGTGSVGLEALSRGARQVVFVEASRRAALLIQRNLVECGFEDAGRVLARPVQGALRQLSVRGEPFDLIFADPPYGQAGALWGLLEQTQALRALLAAGGQFVLQFTPREGLPEEISGLELVGQRRLGDTVLRFWQRPRQDQP